MEKFGRSTGSMHDELTMASRTWQASRDRPTTQGLLMYSRRRDRLSFHEWSKTMRALIVLLTIVGWVATAAAAPKIALPAIEGDDSGDLRDDVVAALDGGQLTVLGA